MVQRSICVGTNLDGAKFTFIYVLKHTQGWGKVEIHL